ncbi:MAG TPA: hypothetical protein VFB95_04295 [Candidatus Cryosericum sp.]|nr:hypothetical protein [Candidatus Cryosericum sp.]
MRYLMAACLAPLLLLPAGASAQTKVQGNPALDRLRATAPGRVDVRWTPDRTRIRTLAGRLSSPRSAPAEEIARTFLLENGELLRLESDLGGLRLLGIRRSPGGRHLAYEQDHDGLPVFDGGIDLHVDGDGAVYLVESRYASTFSTPAVPHISAARAAAAAVEHFLRESQQGPDRGGRPSSLAGPRPGRPETTVPLLGFLTATPSPRLAFRIVLSTRSPVSAVEYFVSAEDGSIAEWRSLEQTAGDGQGKVFDPNPVAFLSDTSLRDLDDAADASFSSAYLSVPLPSLRRLLLGVLGPYTLSGPHVVVNDFLEQPLNPLLVSSDGRFEFTRDQQGFESAMAYYHVDRNQRYIQSLGFDDVNNRAIRADPHGLNGVDNSHYIGFPIGWGYLAFGEGGVDDAEDADVILHEYGHAIQDNQTFGRYLGSGEAGAQGEGFSDYWAFSNSPPGGFDPPCIAEWDLEGGCLRRVDTEKRYPDDLAGEVHRDGEIWSSVLHAAHVALGKEAADRIVLESHFLVPRAPGFCDGARALRQAAATLYDEAEVRAVGRAAADRGIAGDLGVRNLVVLRDETFALHLKFDIANEGHCAVGPATHSIHLIAPGSGFDSEIARVETLDLEPEESEAFDVAVSGLPEPWLYRITIDAEDQEAEIDEDDNSVDSPIQEPPIFGAPPTIHSVDLSVDTETATCDLTRILEGHLCDNGYPADQFASPFPFVILTVQFSEVSLSARVTDPDSTPSMSDVLLVAASFLRPTAGGAGEEVSLILLDDGSQNLFYFLQSGVIPEDCDTTPGACACGPATYPATSHDPIANDAVFTRVLSFVASGPGTPAGPNTLALSQNCIARDRRQSPFPADELVAHPPAFKIEAVDRSGNILQWPVLPPVTIEPTTVSCDGDLCGCCLLMSPIPLAEPADGGCRGLPGLAGVPGSGFENGFCVDLLGVGPPARAD